MIRSYDTTARSGYIRFSRNPVNITKEITVNIFCDLDHEGKLIGIEMIDCIPADLEKISLVLEDQVLA